MPTELFHLRVLREELEKRMQKNSAYSLRAFARAMDIDSANLSKILANKIPLSLKQASKFAAFLKLDDATRSAFILSVIDERRAVSIQKYLGEQVQTKM